MSKPIFLVLFAVVLLLPAAPARANQPAAAQKCDYYRNKMISVEGAWVMPKDCNAYRAKFRFEKSNSSLDCRGSTLSGLDPNQKMLGVNISYPEGKTPENFGLLIVREECDGKNCKPLQNIAVRNCKLTNFMNGVHVVMRVSPTTTKQLRKIYFSSGLDYEARAERITRMEDDLRAMAPQNITLENLDISNMHDHGIYINRYVTGLTLKSSRIVDSARVAIYLESATRNNVIRDSHFIRNGSYDWNEAKRRREDRRDQGKDYREAIAVDSSASNKFIGNTFVNNAAGGIHLYKNCFEHAKAKDNELPRIQHSSDNEIRGNTFRNEPVGVWIASRQAKELSGFKCADPPMHEKDRIIRRDELYYRDYAERTAVIGNKFEDVDRGIIVEDNGAQIRDNEFSGKSSHDIIVGTRIRSLKEDLPVSNVRVTGNRVRSIRHRYGQGDNHFEGNSVPGGGTLLAPCTAPAVFPAQDTKGRSCMMEAPGEDLGLEYKSGTSMRLKDSTGEGVETGVWGSGTFMCENGSWRATKATCCFGKSCKPGKD